MHLRFRENTFQRPRKIFSALLSLSFSLSLHARKKINK
uniref:Uncharacterized protein n=1 Tax=Anguilla anguilla TaxID=7936 RepID=A0A0E9SEF3_ANGAN